jgi:general secretion pathway protein L
MPESVLARQAGRLRMAYAASPLSRFLTWWGHELVGLLPARVRALLAERRDEVLLGLDAGSLWLERRGRRVLERQRFDRAGDTVELRAALAAATRDDEQPPRVLLALPASRVLRRPLSLPAAAEQNLRQVLAFEMDRQTPFRADQVYYDCRVAGRDEATRTLAVELAAVPRAALDPDLAALGELGIALDGVDMAGADGRAEGFNLLPAERRAVRRNVWLQVNLGLAAAVLVLLGVVMAQSVGNREQALAALREQTTARRDAAREVAALRNELKTAVEGANFLAERRRARPPISDLVLDATERLGNDTWLQRLSLNGDQLQLQGQSREAAGLITILQQSPMMEAPALQGAITPDARSGKEQFLIQARVKVPPPPAAAPAAPRPAPAAPEKTDAAAAKS